jgi:hypothetical protein
MYYFENFFGSYLIGIYPLTWIYLLEDVHSIVFIVMAIVAAGLCVALILSILLIAGVFSYHSISILQAKIEMNIRRLLDGYGLHDIEWLIGKREA